MKSKLRKVYIVIEETAEKDGAGENTTQAFNVYMDGDTERLYDGVTPTNDFSAAEFWGSRLFAIVCDAVRKAGAVQEEIDRGKIV